LVEDKVEPEVVARAKVLVLAGMVRAWEVATNPDQVQEATAFARSAGIKSPIKEVSAAWTSLVLNVAQK
jgi:hypothetical protein